MRLGKPCRQQPLSADTPRCSPCFIKLQEAMERFFWQSGSCGCAALAAENKTQTQQTAKAAKAAGDAELGKIGEQETVVKIPLTDLDTLDERFSEEDFKKLNIVWVGSKEQAVIDKAWAAIGDCQKLRENVDTNRLIVGCHSDICPDDEIKDKGMLVLTFNSGYVRKNMD